MAPKAPQEIERPRLQPFNLKLRPDVKSRLKTITHDRGMTMQAVLSAFAESYSQNPDGFRITMEVVNVPAS